MSARRQHGFAVLEQLLGVALIASITTACIHFFSHYTRIQFQQIQHAQALTELNQISTIITNTLSGAHGYKKPIAVDSSTAYLAVGQYKNEAIASCVVFAFDGNRDGHISRLSPVEHYGFRLNKKAIEYRLDAKTCDQGHWQDLTHTGTLLVDKLEFHVSLDASVIDVNIQAHTKTTTPIFVTLSRKMILRNSLQ